MCSGILQLLFNAADIIVVGRYTGSDVFGGRRLYDLFDQSFGQSVHRYSVGANVMIARSYGAGMPTVCIKGYIRPYCLAAVSGLAMIFIGIFAVAAYVEWMGTPANIIDQATLYIRIFFPGHAGPSVIQFRSGYFACGGRY